MKGQWTPHDLRDTVVDFFQHYQKLTAVAMARLLRWAELSPRKFHRRQGRYGKSNEHSGLRRIRLN